MREEERNSGMETMQGLEEEHNMIVETEHLLFLFQLFQGGIISDI